MPGESSLSEVFDAEAPVANGGVHHNSSDPMTEKKDGEQWS